MKIKNAIKLKTPEEIEILRKGGKILSSIVQELQRSLTPGMTTKAIDQKTEALMLRENVTAAFKGYRGFPAATCISVNQEVVHGIPNNRVIKEGDIVSIDVGIKYRSYFVDTAISAGIGRLSPESQRLLDVTRESLQRGINEARAGKHVSDISNAIQRYVESHGFSVVRSFVGHGIGEELHEDPEIPNFGPPNQGAILQEGMVLAIEPMVNMGRYHTRVLNDGWTVVTEDGKPSAHFEHTIVVTQSAPEILT